MIESLRRAVGEDRVLPHERAQHGGPLDEIAGVRPIEASAAPFTSRPDFLGRARV